jgi:hypothetical protein
MMIREIASIIARDFEARTVLVRASNVDSDWLLANELIAAGAQQVDLLVDSPEQANQHLERRHFDSQAIRLIFASHLGLSSTNWVGERGAFVLPRFHHFRDPVESLVRARDLGVKLLCVETAWIEPFSYLDEQGRFALQDGDRLFASRLSATQNRAFRSYFASRGIRTRQFGPGGKSISEAGEIQADDMWMWLMTPAGARDLLRRSGWMPQREIQTWKRGSSMFFCVRIAADRW